MGRVPGSARTGQVQVSTEPWQLPEEQIPEGREEQACAKVPWQAVPSNESLQATLFCPRPASTLCD